MNSVHNIGLARVTNSRAPQKFAFSFRWKRNESIASTRSFSDRFTRPHGNDENDWKTLSTFYCTCLVGANRTDSTGDSQSTDKTTTCSLSISSLAQFKCKTWLRLYQCRPIVLESLRFQWIRPVCTKTIGVAFSIFSPPESVFWKVYAFIENDPSFSCAREIKTQQNVCVFKWKRIRVADQSVTKKELILSLCHLANNDYEQRQIMPVSCTAANRTWAWRPKKKGECIVLNFINSQQGIQIARWTHRTSRASVSQHARNCSFYFAFRIVAQIELNLF